MKVIVYGTLKKGGLFSGYMEDSEYVKDVVVTGFKMYDSKVGYPFVVESKEDECIQGEEYKIDSETLKKLDIVEGTQSGLYKRLDLRKVKKKIKEPTYIYVSTLDRMTGFGLKPAEVKGGFWKV